MLALLGFSVVNVVRYCYLCFSKECLTITGSEEKTIIKKQKNKMIIIESVQEVFLEIHHDCNGVKRVSPVTIELFELTSIIIPNRAIYAENKPIGHVFAYIIVPRLRRGLCQPGRKTLLHINIVNKNKKRFKKKY